MTKKKTRKLEKQNKNTEGMLLDSFAKVNKSCLRMDI